MNPIPKAEDLFGWIGGLLALVYNVPQIYHIWKTKSVKDISKASWTMRTISYFFYIVHTFFQNDPALFYTYILGFLQVIVITIQIFIYKDNNNNTNGRESNSMQHKQSSDTGTASD